MLFISSLLSADVCAVGHRHSRTFPGAKQGKQMLALVSIPVYPLQNHGVCVCLCVGVIIITPGIN